MSSSVSPSIASAVLTNVDTDAKVTGETLWKDRPSVVVVFRRPGCVLCREEAVKVWKLKDTLVEKGVELVGLVHERIPEEVAAFHPKYWPGTLYHDTSKAFYRDLGGGQLLRRNFFTTMLNPFSQMWKNYFRARKSHVESNFKGEGTIMGGLFVFGRGGKVQYKHVEDTFGQHAPHEKILEAAAAVSGK